MPIDRELPAKVLKTYNECISTKEVLYYPSEVTKEDNDLRTEIRLCESLSKKPGPTPEQLNGKKTTEKPKEPKEEPKTKKDVFDPANWDSLLIDEFDGQFGEEYGLLLNKFAVVPLHFLLVTKHYEAQTFPLSPPQLLASYQVLQSFYDAKRSADSPAGELLCFYNCGEMSGASQHHKHVQFAPMDGEGSLGNFPTERAASEYDLTGQDPNSPFSIPSLPYTHFVRRFDSSATSFSTPPEQLMQHLQEVYLSLLDSMIDSLRSLAELGLKDQDGHDFVNPNGLKLGGALSYNLLMTRKHMHIVPRRIATYKLPNTPLSEESAKEGDEAKGAVVSEPVIIGCNALAYTGTVLVKSQSDAKRLVEVGGVVKALGACGYPKVQSQTADVHIDL